MKIINLILIFFIFSLSSCKKNNDDNIKDDLIIISFNTLGGSKVNDINYNGKLETITNPTKEKCIFLGWSMEIDGDIIDIYNYDFIISTTLYARWQEISDSDIYDDDFSWGELH